MKKNVIMYYWLLLLVPTLVIGGMALRLLNHEQARLTRSSHFVMKERARMVAANMGLAVTKIQKQLMDDLEKIPPEREQLSQHLQQLECRNPLVKNVFICSADHHLIWPCRTNETSETRSDFILRYNTLFAGLKSWENASEEMKKGSLPNSSIHDHPINKGWIWWLWEQEFSLLGWVRNNADGSVYGAEIETVTLINHLINVIPAYAENGEVLALLDNKSRRQYQNRSDFIIDNQTPLFTVPIDQALPSYRLAVFLPPDSENRAIGPSFVLVSSLLVVIFIISILTGGSLLFWQAHQNMQNALRKTTFVSNVSHELKTPLTTIRMYTELLGENRIQNAEKQRNYLQVIIAESQRLTRLVNNMLDFSRLEQRTKQYTRENLDLVPTLHEILDKQLLRINQADMKLGRSLPNEPLFVSMDRDALEQTIVNLIDNAVKYAAIGKYIRIELKRNQDEIVISVQDRGPGIPSRQQEQIFESFYRIDDSLTARQPGSGLGLSIARKLMRDLGGDVVCRSGEDGGACFQVILKATEISS